MQNNAVRAAAIGLPNLNRRSALATLGMGIAGGASLATVSAAAAHDRAPSSELLRLIEAHRAANTAFLECIDRFNVVEKSYYAARPRNIPLKWGSGGFIETPESAALKLSLDAADREYLTAMHAESQALMPVCSYRCATLQEARAKSEYLSTADDLDMRPEFLTAFLQSFCDEDGIDVT